MSRDGEPKIIDTHQDLIHDVSFDHYGKRMATCSSDQYVKIFDKDDATDTWRCTASWKAHSGSVWRVTWAHPEFGALIATCSFDRSVQIWEEVANESPGQTSWMKRNNLADNRANVTDVKFAPPHLGLVLATCSQDGLIRVYEAPDIMSLTNWNHAHDVQISKFRCSCLAWNPSKYRAPMFAVGSDDESQQSSSTVYIYEYNESQKEYVKLECLVLTTPVFDLAFAPDIGRSNHTLAVASTSLVVYSIPADDGITSPYNDADGDIPLARTLCQNMVWRVSWDITGTVLAAGSASDKDVQLFKRGFDRAWQKLDSPFDKGLRPAVAVNNATNAGYL